MQRIHPVWRGVGFVMMVLIPIISWAAADVLIKANMSQRLFPMPYDLLAGPDSFLYQIIPDPLIHIRLLFFAMFLVLLFALFTLVTFAITRAFGLGPRSDPYYVPEPRRLNQRRSRR
jgi:hypothetical protein